MSASPSTIQRIASRLLRSIYGRLVGRSLQSDFEKLDRTRELAQSIDLLTKEVQALDQKLRCSNAILSADNPAVPKSITPPETGWKYDEIFILGSGSSLLDLSPDEREILNTLPTIGMNKYLLYWDMVGIWPTFGFLADVHYPASEVLTRSIEEISRNPEATPPIFLLTEDYQKWPLAQWNPIYFKRLHTYDDHPWGKSMDDPMYFYRGSLTCLLNLVSVLKLAPKVTLFGVDLDNGEAFYAERYANDTSLHDHWEALRKSTGVHPTALDYQGMPPIHDRLPWVFERMKEIGISVSAYNSSSLLVKRGLCPLRDRLQKKPASNDTLS